jgi:hypothetical protein
MWGWGLVLGAECGPGAAVGRGALRIPGGAAARITGRCKTMRASVRQVLHTAAVDEKPHGNSVRLVPCAHQGEPFALRARRIMHAA